MFTESEKKQLEKLNQTLTGEIKIGSTAAGHPQGQAFQEFCDHLVQLVPNIKITSEDGSTKQPPEIQIGHDLRYQAIPSGLEMQPFTEALAALGSESSPLSESIKMKLQQNELPATLIAFISPHCTFCPQVIRQLIPLSMADAGVQLVVIDGTLFPEQAQRHKIQSVPTILLDEQFRWTGSVPLAEIVDAISTRNPALLGALSLESILKDGQAGHLAAMMLDADEIFPAFFDLLIHEKWPVRLGAMVVIEEIVEKNHALASAAVDPLWKQFDHVPDQIKGDILYLFGEVADPKVIPWLQRIITGEHDEEVREASREALEKISEQTQ
jgi:thiol-disulfide isomerase/thioredoxin